MWGFYAAALLVLVSAAVTGLTIAWGSGPTTVDPRGVAGGAGVATSAGVATVAGVPTVVSVSGPASVAAGGASASASPTPAVSPSPGPRPSPTPSLGPSPTTPASQAKAPDTGKPTPSPSVSPSPVWTSLTVTATRSLFQGDSWQTNRTKLAMQADGNLVIIDEHGTARWASGTAGAGNRATFQGDGNFVVYDAANRPLWSSRTDLHPSGVAVLVLQTNGDVCVVYQSAPIWCAGTAH
jgi:hypothetical protein